MPLARAAMLTLALVLGLPGPAAAVHPPNVRCTIAVTLDPARHRLSGLETLTYRSGADSALTALRFHTYPNAFAGPRTTYGREAERVAEDYALRFAAPRDLGWMSIDSAAVDGVPARVTVEETLARVDLPHPLPPGDSVIVALRFQVQVPRPFNRFGRAGESYAVAQWYPKICVYDELGWHLDPYHFLAEFYGEFATFDVAITVPDRYWVGATGVMTGASGGDNETPSIPAAAPVDSVSVRLAVVTADSLAGRWPARLESATDLDDAPGRPPRTVLVPRGGRALLRVPRGAPVHYAYRWGAAEPRAREEADEEGRPGPLRLIIARGDTSITDTLRALARPSAPGDSALPSMKTVRFRAARVHDFAWVASPNYVGVDTTWSGISVRSLVFRGEDPEWAGLHRNAVAALRFMSARVGPYAWPWFVAAEAFQGGGAMEYPGLVMIEPAERSAWLESLDLTTAHETAHSWFYGMLGSDERAFPWLDEGFTQFMESEYAEARHPHGVLRRRNILPWIGAARLFDADESRYLARARARDERPIATPADRHESYATYGVSAYIKPSLMLRAMRGEIGDSLFDAFLHEYYRRALFRHPTPDDVERAASDVSGQDLRGFFEQWVEGTGRAGFALGKVRRERTGDRRRTTVLVRRTGEMILPVALEARFADGSRQETRVLPRERETPVVFESRSRLARAVLDPRHEISEPYRLDNRTGWLPPLRWSALYGVPTSDQITIRYGPTLWQGRDEGARAGLWWDGRYLSSSDFPDGVRRISGGVAVGSKGGPAAWRVGASRQAGALGARGSVAASAIRDAGMFRGGMTLSNWITAPGRRHPYRWWSLEAEYRDRYNLDPVDGRYWSAGRSLHAAASLRLETRGPRRLESAELALGRGGTAFQKGASPPPETGYDRLSASVRQSLDLLPRANLHVTWRLFAGSVWRTPPREALFDAAEASRLEAIGSFYLNDRGPVVASGRYWNPGGGGLRGYRGRAILGKRAVGLNLDARLPWVPWFDFFADAGRVGDQAWGEGGASSPKLADAGLTLDLGVVRLTAPLWVGSPAPDERPWRARWLITLGALPRLP
jgi:peptidase M1-like protein